MPGDLGLLIRHEGLYSSRLAAGRCWRRSGHPEHTESPRPPTESQLWQELARVQREIDRLRFKLEHAEKPTARQNNSAKMLEAQERDKIDGNSARRSA